MLQTILIAILGFIASVFLFALWSSKKFEDWLIKLFDMKD